MQKRFLPLAVWLAVATAAATAGCPPSPPPPSAGDDGKAGSSAGPAGSAAVKPSPSPVVAPAAPDLSAAPGARDLGKPAEGADLGAGPGHSLFVRSSRCGECHEKMRIDWNESLHARASRGKVYRKSLDAVGDNAALRALCQSCHLPSASYGQLDDQPGRPSEGVSCDGCHTINKVTVGKTDAVMSFDPSSGKKYGPIVGASGHYFHDMGYSVLHTKSEMCAGCHFMTAFSVGDKARNIPVVLDYADWLKLGKGKSCQDCHMPPRGTEPVARGSKPRPNVPSHGFPGAPVLGKAMQLKVLTNAKPGEVAVEIQHAAGHMVPSGFVDRRLIVRAEFFGAGDAKLHSEDQSFGVFLVDEQDKPAPFFRAARVKEDKRLLPGKPYQVSFKLPPPPATGGDAGVQRVTFTILAAPTAPELAAVYGEPELTVIKSASHSPVPRTGGK